MIVFIVLIFIRGRMPSDFSVVVEKGVVLVFVLSLQA